MPNSSPLAIVLEMVELYNDGTPESYGSDRFLKLLAPTVVVEMMPSAQFSSGRKLSFEELRAELPVLALRMSNRHLTVHETVAEGNDVVMRYTFTATSTVAGPGAPAGSQISIEGADFYTVVDDQIVRYIQLVSTPQVFEATATQ